MSERRPDMDDEELTRRLASELPRHPAPAHLTVRVLRQARPPAPGWRSPAVAALATALAMGLFFVPLLPRATPVDPVQRLVRAVVAEHTRALLWGARRGEIETTSLTWVTQEAGIGLTKHFAGDDRLAFTAAEPVYLEQNRGVALHYRDADGHLLTYVALPAPGLTVPEARRRQVDRWRPALLHEVGFAVWMWKQRDIACFVIADMVSEGELDRFKDYFVRIRAGTEPYLTQ
jgi:anti-sigma factor RsiW